MASQLSQGKGSMLTPSPVIHSIPSVIYMHSLMNDCFICHYPGFFPLLKYVVPEVLLLSLMGSALASGRSIFGADCHWLH